MIRKTLLAACLCALFQNTFSKSILVPANYSTIQAALNSAVGGDEILVSPGTYSENIQWPAKDNIKLVGLAGYRSTVIDGHMTGRVMTISGTNATLKGLTLKNGSLTSERSYGAGIYVGAAGFVMDSCLITNNTAVAGQAWVYGGGMYIAGANFKITNSVFSYNGCTSGNWAYGGGIYVDGVSGVLLGNRFFKNHVKGSWSYGAAVYLDDAPSIVIKATRFERNGSKDNPSYCHGAALAARGSFSPGMLTLENCLMRENYLEKGSFGKKSILSLDEYNLTMINCTVYNSYKNLSSDDYFGIEFQNFFTTTNASIVNSILWGSNKTGEFQNNEKNTLSVIYSDVQGGFSGAGNIQADPIFADSVCHLATSSPCLGKGNSSLAPLVDIDGYKRPYPVGTQVDMGAYEYPTFKDPITTLDDNTLLAQDMELYPNPTSKAEFVKANLSTGSYIIEVHLYDSKGTEMFGQTSFENKEATIRVGNIPQGYYLVKISDDKGTQYNKGLVVD